MRVIAESARPGCEIDNERKDHPGKTVRYRNASLGELGSLRGVGGPSGAAPLRRRSTQSLSLRFAAAVSR